MKQNKKEAVIVFFKRNGYYMLLGICVLAIVLMVTFAIIAANKKGIPVGTVPPDDVEVVVPDPDQPTDGNQDGENSDGNNDQPTGGNQDGENSEPTSPVDKPVAFLLPVANCTVLKEYTDTGVEYNQTLGRYEGHMGIDFGGEENAAVVAVYDGTVESVTTSFLEGTRVVIDHGNNLKTVYTSLAGADFVEAGQTVAAGDKIGEISTSAAQEYKDGAHLHFECFENGVRINPEKYLLLDQK